jgi:hypothetical protein
MQNPYEPPKPPKEEEKSVFDEGWFGRECFALGILFLTLLCLIDMLFKLVLRYASKP